MPNRSAALSLRLVLLAAGLTQLAACGSGSKAVKPAPAAAVNALYAQLDQASQSYETALQQTRAGNAAMLRSICWNWRCNCRARVIAIRRVTICMGPLVGQCRTAARLGAEHSGLS